MGTFYFDVAHRGQCVPDNTGYVFYDSMLNHGATNKNQLALILKDNSSVAVVSGSFPVLIGGGTPSDGFLKIQAVVNSTSTAQLAFIFKYRCVDGAEDSDTSIWDETCSNCTLTGATAEFLLLEKSIDLTHGNFADADLCEYQFGIDGPNHAIVADIIVQTAYVQLET